MSWRKRDRVKEVKKHENIIWESKAKANHLICTLVLSLIFMVCARMSSQCVAFIAWCSYVIYYLFLWKTTQIQIYTLVHAIYTVIYTIPLPQSNGGEFIFSKKIWKKNKWKKCEKSNVPWKSLGIGEMKRFPMLRLYRFVQVFKWKSIGKLTEREQQKYITTK